MTDESVQAQAPEQTADFSPVEGPTTESFESPELKNTHADSPEQARPDASPPTIDQLREKAQKSQIPTMVQLREKANSPETYWKAVGTDISDHGFSPASWIADAIIPPDGKDMTDSQRILVQRHPIGHIVDAFTQAFSNAYEEQAPLSPEMTDALKRAGTYKEYMAKSGALDQGFLQGVALPLAKDLWSATKSGLISNQGAFIPDVTSAAQLGSKLLAAGGALIEGGHAAIEAARPELGDTVTGGAHEMFEYSYMRNMAGEGAPVLPQHVAQASDMGILARATSDRPLTPIEEKSARYSAQMYSQRLDEYHEAPSVRPKPVITDIHEAAAAKDPEAFRQRDALDARRDTLMRWHADAAEKLEAETEKKSPFIEELNKQREKLETGSPKNRKVYQARVDDLEAKHNSWMLDQVREGTPFMKDIQEQLDENDRQRVALAHTGRISEAYRSAQSEMPPEGPKPAADVPPAAAPEKPAAAPEVKPATEKKSSAPEEKPLITSDAQALLKSVDGGGVPFTWTKNLRRIAKENGFKETVDTRPADLIDHLRSKIEPAKPEPVQEHVPAPEPEPELPVKPGEMSIEAQKDEIAAEVKKQLVAAGRPEEEAALAARLEAERFAIRAKRFEGKRGNALEFWRSLGARVKEGQLKAVKSVRAKKVKEVKLYEAPIMQEIVRQGGIDENSQVAQDLRAIGIKNGEKGVPFNFFRKQKEGGPKVGMGELDNWVAREFNDKFDTRAKEDGNGNVDKEWLVDRIRDEFQGAGKKLGEQYEKETEGRASDNQADIFDSIKEDVTTAAKKMGVEGLTDKEIESIVSKLKDDITLDAEDAIADHIEREAITEFGQSARGKIRMGAEKVRSIITILGKGDASTFIHEIGHDWLDQLLKDAEHPDAPQSLKDDADIVKKWTGIDSWRRPKDKKSPEYKAFVRGHEKWARGVERRLMEGTAPSRELDHVFAKFKGWLTQIYKTFDSLHAPITDDIRGVMDRLLADQPSSAVLARDREPGEALAGMHERDAAELSPDTPAYHADAVRDHIDNEMDATAKHFNDEVRNALDNAKQTGSERSETEIPAGPGEQAGEPSGATGPAQEPAQVGGGGGQSGTTSGQERTAEPTGATGPGPGTTVGSGDGTESGGTAAGDGSRGAGGQDSGAHAQPDDVVNSEPTFWDKAGNIRLDLLSTTEKVKQALRELAEQNDDFKGARRGEVSVYDQQQMAESMGIEDRELNIQKLRQMSLEDGIPLAARIRGGRLMLVQAAQACIEAGKSVARDGSAEAAIAFVQARDRFLMIGETVAGITAEWGRAGNAFKDMSKVQTGNMEAMTELFQSGIGKSPEEVMAQARAVAMIDTSSGAAKAMRMQGKPTLGKQIIAMVVNGLISNPKTHISYSIANRFLMHWNAMVTTPVEWALDRTMVQFGKKSSGIQLGETGAMLKAHWTSMPEQVSAAIKAGRSGVATLLPGDDTSWQQPFQFGDRQSAEPGRVNREFTTWAQVGCDVKGILSGAKDSFVTMAQAFKSGNEEWLGREHSPQGPIPNYRVKGIPVPVGGTITLPGRMVSVVHSFDKTAAYAMRRAALIYRRAASEGLKGDAFDNRVKELTKNTPNDIVVKASQEAPADVLMSRVGAQIKNLPGGSLKQVRGFMNKFSNLVGHDFDVPVLGETPVLKLVDPFVHISSNMLTESVGKRTPIGLVSRSIRDDLSGKNGVQARNTAWANSVVIPTLFTLAVGHLVASGYATGSISSKPSERSSNATLTGEMPHSVRIGDNWYDLHRMGVVGMMFSLATDWHYIAAAATQEETTQVASLFMNSIVQNIKDESFMRGLSDLFQAIDDPDRHGPTWIKNIASMFVPFSAAVNAASVSSDPYQRQARTLIDGIMARLPGVREDLYPRRDVWGQPVPNHPTVGVSSIAVSKALNDPTGQTLRRLGMFPAPPQRKLAGVTLTDMQYDQFCAMAGHLAKMHLDAMVNTKGFSQMPEFVQRNEIKQIIEKSRKQAAAAVMMRPENANIIKDSIKSKTGGNRPVVNGIEVR